MRRQSGVIKADIEYLYKLRPSNSDENSIYRRLKTKGQHEYFNLEKFVVLLVIFFIFYAVIGANRDFFIPLRSSD
jgi:hypothetical protein